MENDEEMLLPNNENDESTANCEELGIDSVLELTGSFGRFQILLQILLFCIISLSAYQEALLYFIGYSPPWTCVQRNSSDFCAENFGKVINTFNSNFTERCHLKRDEWEYISKKDFTFITEFDLVCDKSTIGSIAGAIFFIGTAFGAVASGILADLLGRKWTLFLSLLFTIAVSVVSSFVKSIWQLIAMRFVCGVMTSSVLDLAFVLMTESVPSRLRPVPTNICLFASVTSNFLMDWLAYHEKDWRLIQRYCQLPSLFFLLFIIWVPESPRWLLSVGKEEKSTAILKRIANLNKKPLHNFKLKSNSVLSSEDEAPSKHTYLDILKVGKLRNIILIQSCIGMTIGLTILTSVLQVSNLGRNIYASYAIVTVVSIPAFFISVPLCSRFGRKKATLIPFLFSGVLLGFIAVLLFFRTSIKYLLVILNVTSKCFATVALSCALLWFFELYPTVVRMRCLAVGGFMIRIGSAGAPFFTNTLESVNVSLPFLIMFIMTLLAAILGIFLSETKDQPSRETLDDLLVTSIPVNVEVNNECNEFE